MMQLALRNIGFIIAFGIVPSPLLAMCTQALCCRVACCRSIMNLVCLFSMVCCGDVRRQYPANYVLLALFTITEAFMVSVIASRYTAASVVLAIAMVFVITLALTLFAFQVPWVTYVLDPLKTISCFCNLSVREKD